MLGEFLTASEAEALAVQFESGQHTIKALTAVNTARRERAKQLLVAAGLGHQESFRTAAVLKAIAGAKSLRHDLTPVWTMPGNEAKVGHLTGEFHRLVEGARIAVTCATYNFQDTSNMWGALKYAAAQPGVTVTVYVDGEVVEATSVKDHLPKATVYRSRILPGGKRVRSHAKFVIIDHQYLLLTSANFSYSAEQLNIEFGLLVHDSALAESVESSMASKHGILYELA
ncbi:MAG TPA: DISARM system phospholipase D-like protein DrmC [Jatrophihabitans sp.]|nr:DISARM system phospholipase D-like protein DrmC [Jatrophihabitans sp.]